MITKDREHPCLETDRVGAAPELVSLTIQKTDCHAGETVVNSAMQSISLEESERCILYVGKCCSVLRNSKSMTSQVQASE